MLAFFYGTHHLASLQFYIGTNQVKLSCLELKALSRRVMSQFAHNNKFVPEKLKHCDYIFGPPPL